MLTHALATNKAPLKKRRTQGSFGTGGEEEEEDSFLESRDDFQEDEPGAGITSRASQPSSPPLSASAPAWESSSLAAPPHRLGTGRLNREVVDLMGKFVKHYVDPKHQNARMSSLQLNPHFYPYYHQEPLTSSEKERVMTTLADSFSGLEFKGNQMFLEQVFKLRPNVLQYLQWVPFEKLTQFGGSRLRGNEVVMDQWIFSTEALEPGSRQLPGQLLNSRRQQETQAVHNYGVGFRTSLDYFMEPTKLNAYNKNLEALSATILQTMEKQLLQTIFQRSTHYRIGSKYNLPFGSEAQLGKALSAMCNERFAIQKNGAGIRALESNAYNELRNIGMTPEAVLLSPEVMRHENVVNPDNRILGRLGKSAQEAAPAKEGSGYDLQTVRGMKTPTYGLTVNQSRSFRNMDTEEMEDPTHTVMYNSSRWSMHPLPHEHESSSKYRTAHRTIGIVDGDREEIRYLTLHDVLTNSKLWDLSESEWTEPMKDMLKKMTKKKNMKDIDLSVMCGEKHTHVLDAVARKVTLYTKDADAHPEIESLWRIVTKSGDEDKEAENLTIDEIQEMLENLMPTAFPRNADDKPNAPIIFVQEESDLIAKLEQWRLRDAMLDRSKILISDRGHDENKTYMSNYRYFTTYCAHEKDVVMPRVKPDRRTIRDLPFTASLAAAMLEADVPLPLGFHVYRMREKFVGGSAVYFNRKSVVMAVKSCSLLTTNDADTFQTEVQVKFQAGAVVLENRSLLAQHNVVAVRYEEGAGTTFMKWGHARSGGDLIVVPVPANAEPKQLYSCILGLVPESILPSSHQKNALTQGEKRVYTYVEEQLGSQFNAEIPGRSIFEAEGVLHPNPKDQVLAMRGSCLRYDIHSGRMVDTEEGRTALGKACSVEQFQQLKGESSDLGGDGVRGPSYGLQGAFHG